VRSGEIGKPVSPFSFSGQDDATCGRTSRPNLDDEILTTEAAYWVNLVQLEPGDA